MNQTGHDRPDTARDHLANERTLLAWVRTAITIIGLGFVVARLEVVQGREPDAVATLVGAALVTLGGVASIAAGARFVRTEREIEAVRFRPRSSLDLILTAGVTVAALVLAGYLLLVTG